MKINQSSKASVEFDITRPLRFSRMAGAAFGSTYIYSRAVDGVNSIRVAKVSLGLDVGLTTEQENALLDRIADEIVAPSFSEDEIADIAFEIMDCEGIHSTVCEHHIERARRLCDDITHRRRLNLSGAR